MLQERAGNVKENFPFFPKNCPALLGVCLLGTYVKKYTF